MPVDPSPNQDIGKTWKQNVRIAQNEGNCIMQLAGYRCLANLLNLGCVQASEYASTFAIAAKVSALAPDLFGQDHLHMP